MRSLSRLAAMALLAFATQALAADAGIAGACSGTENGNGIRESGVFRGTDHGNGIRDLIVCGSEGGNG